MSRPKWFVEVLKKVYPARELAALMTNLPLVGRIVEYGFFYGDEVYYLPRDSSIKIQEPIPLPENLVLPSEIVDHFIKNASLHWIMNECLCRTAAGCHDYPRNLGCIFLGDAVKNINPNLGRMVSSEEALAHAQKARNAGLVQMIGKNRIDSIWLGTNSSNKLMTICSCCPCCCFYRALPYLNPSISSKIKKMPGVQIEVTENCAGCGVCTEGICFVEAIELKNGRAIINDECRGCGQCVEICPNEAIELKMPGEWAISTTIELISSRVNLS